MGGGAKASKDGRMTDALTQDRLNASNNAANLNAAEFNIGTPVTRAQQVAKGDLMAAMIPNASRSGSGRDLQLTGGVNPGLFGADTTAAGNELKKQALQALMTGSDKQTPVQSTIQKPGLMEKIGGVAGTAGGILGALSGFNREPVATMSQQGPYDGGYRLPHDPTEDTYGVMQ